MGSFAVLGGKVDQEGFNKPLLHLFRTGYSLGMNATQRGAGANMSVDINLDSALSMAGALMKTSANVPYYGYIDSLQNATVTTSDPSNPRRDILVAYVDLSLISTAVTNNPGAFKFLVVPGTAAASPSDPSGATIQTAIGAGNPYVPLARVRLPAAASSVTNAIIDDLRTPMALQVPYLWGGATNTLGHLVPNAADDTLALLNAVQTLAGKTLQTPSIISPVIRTWDGWLDANESWTFASATTINVPTDATLKYQVGDKIKFTQGGVVKYGYITGVTSTVLTVPMMQDSTGAAATVANTTITLPAYSHDVSPLGHPIWLPFVASTTGYSVNPTIDTAKYKIVGRECTFMYRAFGGTSNATTLGINLPVQASSVFGVALSAPFGRAYDNGAFLTSTSELSIAPASSTASFGAAINGAGWTASGGKGVIGQASYPI